MNFLLKENLKIVSTQGLIVDFNGTWKNQLGSIMKINSSRNGNIKGRYITAVGAHGMQKEFNLEGKASGDLIAFIVDFKKYGSLTSWTGQHTLVEKREKINTLWHLAKNFSDDDEKENIWSAIWTGADDFYKI